MTLKDITKVLRLDSHHAMERFTVVFLSMTLGMGVICTGAFASSVENAKINIADTAIYNPSFINSLTSEKGEIAGVYTNEDKTKAFILLKRDNTATMSTDARDYSTFVTAARKKGNPTHLNADPAGAFYVFGNTGYYGLYMVNNLGFQKQALDIIVRENEPIAKKNEEVESVYEKDDTSFSKFDQSRIYVNPGATDTIEIEALESDEAPSPVELYSQTVTMAKEQEIKKKLDSDLSAMKEQLAKISEYKKRLEREGVIVPEDPEDIRGDSIVENEDGTLKLETAYVMPKGYDFDWRSSSVSKGYLQYLKTAEDISDEAFFIRKRNEIPDTIPAFDDWRLTDGTAIEDLNTGSGTDRYTSLKSTIADFQSAQQDYRNMKSQYQINDLESLLMLENQQNGLAGSATINTGEQALKVYSR